MISILTDFFGFFLDFFWSNFGRSTTFFHFLNLLRPFWTFWYFRDLSGSFGTFRDHSDLETFWRLRIVEEMVDFVFRCF